MKIVKNTSILRKPLEAKELSIEVQEEITDLLERVLLVHGGIGLAANQIGSDIRACIINVIEPMVLINPKIVKRSQEMVAYAEQCLSDDKSMKKPVKTVRHKTVTVECDNLGLIEFGPEADVLNPWKNTNDFFNDRGMLECVCVQHEIDHLDGILMTHPSRKYSTTVYAPKKYGRNEKVMVKLPDGKVEFMKYKKAAPMLEHGCVIV